MSALAIATTLTLALTAGLPAIATASGTCGGPSRPRHRRWRTVIPVLLTMVGIWAAAPSGAQAAGALTITALGHSSPNGAVAVNAAHEVLMFNGSVWKNGSVIVPQAPASDPTATFTAEAFGNAASLSESGIAVGEATTGSGATVPAYWDTAHSAAFTEVSLSGLTVNGQPAVGGYLTGVDAAGEAVGMVGDAEGWPASYNPSADDAGLFVPASGGLPVGQPSVVSSIGGTTIFSLDAISASYEAANEADDDVNYEVLVDRQTQSATTTNLMPTEGGPIGFADNGSMTGFAGPVESLRAAGGGETALVSPAGEVGPVTDVNDAGVSVGSLTQSNDPANVTGVSWDAAGAATDLLSQVSDPAGWSALVPAAIDKEGDIVGRGLFNGIQQEAFLIGGQAALLSGTAVHCVLETTGSSVDTCTVTVTNSEGDLQTPTGAVSVSASAGVVGPSATCGLIATGSGVSSCSVDYVPPGGLGAGSTFPVVTATYPGDGSFSPGTGSQTLDCASGAVVDLNSVQTSAFHTNGYEVGSSITLNGCGLSSGTVARFGDDNATASPAQASDVAADGTSITVTVPDYALTGPLSFKNPAGAVATLAKPNPLPIDSWRNTNGFSFHNFGATIPVSDFISEFPTSDLTYPGTTELRLWALGLYNKEKSPDGVCFGLALTSAEFSDGALDPSTLQSGATTGYDLKDTAALRRFIAKQWLSQFSDQALPYQLRMAGNRAGSVSGYLHQALGANGFRYPAVLAFGFTHGLDRDAHAEAVYGLSQQPGYLSVETADSNIPFSTEEASDTTGQTHQLALTGVGGSWARLLPNGVLGLPAIPASARANAIYVIPAAALEGPLTVSRNAFALTGGSVTTAAGVVLDGVQSPTGQTLNPAGDDGVTVIEDNDASTETAQPGAQHVMLTHPNDTVTVSDGHGVSALWQTSRTAVDVAAGAGELSARLNGSAFSVKPAKGHTAPKTATVMLTNKLDGDRSERTVEVTGPADMTVALSGSSPTVTAPTGGRYTITLTGFAPGQPVQSALLGGVAVPKGGTLTLQPGSWSKLATTQTVAVIRHGRTTSRTVLRNRLKAPAARVTRVTVSGANLRVGLRIPALTAEQGTITVTATRRGLPRQSATLSTGGRAHTATITLRLRRAIPKTARLTLKVTTINGGSTPTETTTIYRNR